MHYFKELLGSGKTVITVEVTPPRGPDIEAVLRRVEKLKGVADAVDVTATPMARLHMSSIIFAYILRERLEIDVIANVTARDKNILGIESELLGAHALGIRNLVLLKGDRIRIGDYPDGKEVYDVDTLGLLRLIKNLNIGLDAAGREIQGETDFLAGAVINPNAQRPADVILKSIKEKIDESAGFLLTQPVYSIDMIRKFRSLIDGINKPVILGILPLKSRAMAMKVATGLPGVSVPKSLLEKIENLADEDIKKFSFDHSLGIMDEVAGEFGGFHIMTAGDLTYAKSLIEAFRTTHP